MQMNSRMDRIGDYPFDRLRSLLGQVSPPDGVTPIMLSIGEPRHAPPEFVTEVISSRRDGWGRYPPMKGPDEARRAIVEWLCRRYSLPGDIIDPETMVLPVSGTREALFMIALAAVPEKKSGMRPVALVPGSVLPGLPRRGRHGRRGNGIRAGGTG